MTTEPFLLREDDAIEVGNIGESSQRSQRDLGGAGDERATRNLDVLTLDRIAHLVYGDAVGVQPVRIEENLDLAPPLSGELDLRHTAGRFEDLLDLLVDNLAEFLEIAIAVDGDGQNGTGIGIRLLNDRCRGIAAKLVDDRPDLVADVLDRNVHVFFKHEIDVDVGVALIGICPQFVDAFDRIDGCFDGKRERRFDFFGAGTGKLDAYVDVGLLGSWHQVDAKAPVGKDPEGHERHRHHQCEYRAANTDVRYLH